VQRARERERQRHIFVVEPHRVQGSKDFLLACTGLKSTGLQIQTSWRGNLREVSSVPETASQKTRKSEYLKNSSTPCGTLLHKKTDTKKTCSISQGAGERGAEKDPKCVKLPDTKRATYRSNYKRHR
jgi:hypothetical protein